MILRNPGPFTVQSELQTAVLQYFKLSYMKVCMGMDKSSQGDATIGTGFFDIRRGFLQLTKQNGDMPKHHCIIKVHIIL